MAPLPSPVSKDELFSQTFAQNSTLDDSGLVPPSPPPSDYFMSTIEILRNDVLHALAGLNPRKAYGPDGVPPIVLKNCASVLAPTPGLIRIQKSPRRSMDPYEPWSSPVWVSRA
ncbi:hypothetical protein E2C01_092267 [Portunus trituberculatus]|uniref:Uncharacterized protein n=1 Tax=Portunus trituberculatus TaxID=210409 RepID=A0A5B7JLA9_PORTR|nr:hypothetical protein [Portunus trituberculatus]